MNYFKALFATSTQITDLDFLEGLNGRISDNMNSELNKMFTKEEVCTTLNLGVKTDVFNTVFGQNRRR